MQRAYLTDATPVQSAPLSDVYKVITGHPDRVSVPTLHRERIETWRNRRFFSVPAPAGGADLLFAPAGATVYQHPDVGDDLKDGTRHLVTVLPAGANVRVTTWRMGHTLLTTTCAVTCAYTAMTTLTTLG